MPNKWAPKWRSTFVFNVFVAVDGMALKYVVARYPST